MERRVLSQMFWKWYDFIHVGSSIICSTSTDSSPSHPPMLITSQSHLNYTAMSFNYGPPPPGKRGDSENGPAAKRAKYASPLLDLPTHLPNLASPPSQPPIVEKKEPEKPAEEPIFIEGTTISLQTEEDIAKWIEERKKNWPTRKNVEAKLKQQQERKEEKPEKPKRQNICRFFAKNKKCRFGNKCKNLHEAANLPLSNSKVQIINGIEVAVPQRYKNDPSNNKSFYKKLVQRDLYEHENNKVLDFLLWLDQQGKIDHDVNA